MAARPKAAVKGEIPKDPEKVDRILTSALHEFAQAGFRNAKTDVIASEAQVSKGLLFHYFGNKANLYYEVSKWSLARMNRAADFNVWQSAPNLKVMIERAMRYKIKMQLDYQDDFAFSLALYGGTNKFPEALAAKLQGLLDGEMKMATTDLAGPVLDRMTLREGVSLETVRGLFLMMANLISDKAQAYMTDHPDVKVDDLEWLVQESLGYIDVLEHGFLAE
ncbi:hypothetical protein AYR62_06245 [Secundilactobacillus paracollinoides]|uniref:HTH tetR-type domain-containing protein n=1 Tax=Secundilactobacillus paracollinoides TaxID=240427 RepID=A0A1B2J125_9LACO|nr:TetR/AcrR family transcriptional regulator [Secundilactobacillus paracollinoides]ANZ62048.1 hypothetical protein AYR61_12260 [Secundilactobacillus paracollinoides]ANZ63732.1 hypothetical protein AYR62_06245 [Secundilactobacillus paracollinoides]ANZ67993.1 hypothetical protein AYR63_13150 [Secundilactobacillus paracollinoides]